MIDLFGGSQVEKHRPMTGRHDNPGGGIGRKGCLDYNLGQDVSSERIKEHPGHLSWWPKPEP